MAARPLKLGTRRSMLARAQSSAVARQLEQLHPHLKVELVGIDTRGDRVLDRPLRAVEGKEFFTAQIDEALLRGEIDFTVHSYKDLSLERAERFLLAAVPPRAQPNDVVLFARDVPQRLAAGEELVIGSSSPRRASFVPDFLRDALPHAPGDQAQVRIVELRGNVDTRLRRLQEPRGSARQLDGVVLAFAGVARLWADPLAHEATAALLLGMPRMVLPLSACPAAPAQGALALECRLEDVETARLLAPLDDPRTRENIEVERVLLAKRGGGCHQRFGATQIELPGAGKLLYARAAEQHGEEFELGVVEMRWSPTTALPPPGQPVRAWDGTRATHAEIVPLAGAAATVTHALAGARALFIAHRRALPEQVQVRAGTPLWVPGLETWRALAQRGIWVEGCAEGLGFAHLKSLLAEPWLTLPSAHDWTILTHARAAPEWAEGHVIATYESAAAGEGPPADATHVYWASGAQFERWQDRVGADTVHACGPGKTYDHLVRSGLRHVHLFPQVQQWRQWLQF